jgi:hypothetical protein
MGQSHEKFIFLGMTEVIVVGETSFERVIFNTNILKKRELKFPFDLI